MRRAELKIPSIPGNERLAMQWVGEMVAPLDLGRRQLDRLKTAVAETTMNAIEHRNQNRAELPVVLEIEFRLNQLEVRISDHDNGLEVAPTEVPDLEAKLAGLQSPRGWGLFLIEQMVDEVRVSGDETHRTVALVLNLAAPTI